MIEASGPGGLTVYFKYVRDPYDVPITEWQREVWNQGFAPLLWLISPEGIELHNGFGTPGGPDEAQANRARCLPDRGPRNWHGLTRSRAGSRWKRANSGVWSLASAARRVSTSACYATCAVSRRTLVGADLDRAETQALIGRCVFAKYLFDRKNRDPQPPVKRVRM